MSTSVHCCAGVLSCITGHTQWLVLTHSLPSAARAVPPAADGRLPAAPRALGRHPPMYAQCRDRPPQHTPTPRQPAQSNLAEALPARASPAGGAPPASSPTQAPTANPTALPTASPIDTLIATNAASRKCHGSSQHYQQSWPRSQTPTDADAEVVWQATERPRRKCQPGSCHHVGHVGYLEAGLATGRVSQ